MLTHSFGQLAHLLQRQISLFRSALCWMALILVSANALADTCPNVGELVLHRSADSMNYTTRSGWQSVPFQSEELAQSGHLRFAFAVSNRDRYPNVMSFNHQTPKAELVYCAYVIGNNGTDNPRIELSIPTIRYVFDIWPGFQENSFGPNDLGRCSSNCYFSGSRNGSPSPVIDFGLMPDADMPLSKPLNADGQATDIYQKSQTTSPIHISPF